MMHILLLIWTCFLAVETFSPPLTCPLILTREKWGGRSPVRVNYSIFPVDYVITHRTGTPPCWAIPMCKLAVQRIQDYHMDRLHWDDIGYSFLIGSEGTIFEGRGWHKVGATASDFSSSSISIGIIGPKEAPQPTLLQKLAVQKLLKCGVALGEISEDFKVFETQQFEPEEEGVVFRDINWLGGWKPFASQHFLLLYTNWKGESQYLVRAVSLRLEDDIG